MLLKRSKVQQRGHYLRIYQHCKLKIDLDLKVGRFSKSADILMYINVCVCVCVCACVRDSHLPTVGCNVPVLLKAPTSSLMILELTWRAAKVTTHITAHLTRTRTHAHMHIRLASQHCTLIRTHYNVSQCYMSITYASPHTPSRMLSWVWRCSLSSTFIASTCSYCSN